MEKMNNQVQELRSQLVSREELVSKLQSDNMNLQNALKTKEDENNK